MQIAERVIRAFQPTPEGWVFVALTWLLAAWALLQVRKQGLEVREEQAALQAAQSRLPEANAVESDWDTWRDSLVESSLIAKYVFTLWEMRKMAEPDLSAALAAAAGEFGNRLKSVRLIPNMVMLIGLLGTVVGLAHVVQALGPVIIAASQDGSPQQMAQDIARQMGQLQTAFACTVNGILAAILTALAVNNAERTQNTLLADMEEYGVATLAPRLLPPAPLNALTETLRQSTTLASSLLQTMSDATQDFSKQVARFNTITFDAASNFEAIADDVTTSAEQLAASTDKLNENVGMLDKLQKEMHSLYTTLVRRHEKAEETFISQTGSIIGKMDSLQKGYNTNTQAIIEQLQTASGNYTLSTHAFREAGDNFSNMSKEIGDRAFDAVALRVEAIVKAGKTYQQAVESVDQGLRDTLDKMGELMTRLDPRLLPREEWDRTALALDRVSRVAEQILQTPQAREQAVQSGITLETHDLVRAVERMQQTWQETARVQMEHSHTNAQSEAQQSQEEREILRALTQQLKTLGTQLARQNRAEQERDLASMYSSNGTADLLSTTLVPSAEDYHAQGARRGNGQETLPDAASSDVQVMSGEYDRQMLGALQNLHSDMQTLHALLARPWWQKLPLRRRAAPVASGVASLSVNKENVTQDEDRRRMSPAAPLSPTPPASNEQKMSAVADAQPHPVETGSGRAVVAQLTSVNTDAEHEGRQETVEEEIEAAVAPAEAWWKKREEKP